MSVRQLAVEFILELRRLAGSPHVSPSVGQHAQVEVLGLIGWHDPDDRRPLLNGPQSRRRLTKDA